MHRIDGAGHVDHLFVAEDPATFRPPTEITPEIMNAFQEEMASFIEWAGIVLAKGDNTQLRQALLAKFATKAGIQTQENTAFTTTGATGAFVLTPNPAIDAYGAGQRFRVKFHAGGNGADTINVSGKGVKSLKQYDSTGAKVAAVIAANQLTDMEYDGVDMVVLDPLPTANANIGQLKNLVINGGCQVSQRTATNLTTTATYGQVDRFASWATGTAVSAGTISQDTASPIGRTGHALKLAGVTISGAGVVYARQRIESINAKRLKNQVASFSVQVHHDVGAAINYVVKIRKPNGADNYSGSTIILAGAAVAVPSAQGTQLTLPNVAMGDCSNGIEIEVQAQCGAVNAKNFSFTEWQLEEGAAVSSFERRDFVAEELLCKRYYETSTSMGTSYSGYVVAAYSYFSNVFFKVQKRVVPSVVMSYPGGNTGFPTTVASASSLGTASFTAGHTANVTTNNGLYCYQWTADAEL